jgi:hypothetical protein
MIGAFGEKVQNVLPPAAIVNTASYPCNVIDTWRADYLKVDVILGALDIALTVLKLQESDTKASATTLTSGTDITASIFGTANNDTGVASTLPSATDDTHVFSFFVDLRGHKRYILPVITIGTGSTGGYCCVLATLLRNAEGPRLASDAGYTQRLVM